MSDEIGPEQQEVIEELTRTSTMAIAYLKSKERDGKEDLSKQYLDLMKRAQQISGSVNSVDWEKLANSAIDALNTALIRCESLEQQLQEVKTEQEETLFKLRQVKAYDDLVNSEDLRF
tara:strand:+ start:119 stop:472 length:354 start_codon:yes stop_codon:yes gene_type:complete